MTKNTFKIVRHYGNKDLKAIIENLVSLRLSNFKLNSGAYDKKYNKIDTAKTLVQQEANN